MGQIKTKPGEIEVELFLETLDARRLEESDILIDMMSDITGKSAIMWGKSIIGFDPYRYKSKSGQENNWPRIAFSPRKAKMTLYVTMDAERYLPSIKELGGKTSIGKGCIYINKLEDIDLTKLRNLIERAYVDSKKIIE